MISEGNGIDIVTKLLLKMLLHSSRASVILVFRDSLPRMFHQMGETLLRILREIERFYWK